MKRTKKIIAILLVAIMVVCALPMTAFAESTWNSSKGRFESEHVNEIYTSIDVPIVGELYSSDIEVPASPVKARIACWWKGGTLQNPEKKIYSGIFVGGETYYVDVEFSDVGVKKYCINSNTAFYINGQLGRVCYESGSDYRGNKVSARVAFTVSADRINDIDISIATPVSDRCFSSIKYNKTGYDATIVKWYHGNDFNDLSRVKGYGEYFVANEPYIAEVVFTSETQKFEYYPKILINGNAAYISNRNEKLTSVTVLYKFTALKAVNLNEVTGEFLREPKYGASVPDEIYDYSTRYDFEIDKWMWRNRARSSSYDTTDDEIISNNSSFSYGSVYALYARVIPKDNYSLTDYTTVKINGVTGQLQSTDVNTGTRVYRFPFTILDTRLTEITNASATVANTSKPSNSVVADSSDYSVRVKGWWKCLDSNVNPEEVYSRPDKYVSVDNNHVFTQNKYVVAVEFTPKTNKALTTSTVVKINGLEAYCYAYDLNDHSGEYMIVLNKKSQIDTLTARVIEPIVGETKSSDITLGVYGRSAKSWEETGYTAQITGWYKGYITYSEENPMDENEKFEPGLEYFVNVRFEPTYGKTISPDATVYINGYYGFFEKKVGNGNMVIYSRGFDPVDITEVNATLDPAIIGNTPDYTAKAGSSAYTITVDNWYEGGVLVAPGTIMDSQSTFENGTKYFVDVTATPSRIITSRGIDDYFDDLDDSVFKINGKTGIIVERYNPNSSDGSVKYRLEFPLPITEMSAAIFTPFEGDQPVNNISYDSESYRAFLDSWYVGGTVQNPGSKITGTTKFILGQTYIAKVEFVPKDGFGFGASPTAKINGIDAYKSSDAPLTFNVAFVAKEKTKWIPSVTITDGFAMGGLLCKNVYTPTPNVTEASISWERNGAPIGAGSIINCGEYKGKLRLVTEVGYYFNENTEVKIFGKTITGGNAISSGMILLIDIPPINITCSHIDRTPHNDGDNHWRECDDCGEIFDLAEHSWFVYSTSNGQTTYHCSNCNATKVLDGICVQQYHINTVVPIVGNATVDITPKNSIYADQALVTSTKWYSVRIVEGYDLPRNFKLTTAGRKYIAVITLEAQNDCYFDDSLSIWTSYGWVEAEIIDSQTARATIEYTATERKFVSVVLPEVSIGRTVGEALNDFTMSANGVAEDSIITVKQVGGFNYGILYSASTGNFTSANSSITIENMLSTKFLANKTYSISAFSGDGEHYVYESDVEVTNDYGAVYSFNANSIFYSINATYETGTGIIEYIDISGIVPPVIGESTSTNIESIKVNVLGLETVNTTWWDESNNYAFTFESGKQYTLLITLQSRIDNGIGYKFATDVMVNANCKDATVTGKRAESFSYIYSIRITFPPLSADVNVSGLLTNYGEADDNISVCLLPEGTSEVAYEATVSSGNYSFGAVAAGNYIMRVTMENHIPREYAVTVGSDALSQDIELWQVGDVNEDGEIDIRDLIRLKKKAAGDTNAENASADLNQDGRIDALDATDMRKMLLAK